MINIKNINGIQKNVFNVKVKLKVFFHFLPKVMKGQIGLRKFTLFLRRLLLFLSKLQHNKFVRIGDKTRIDLYVPGFPSRAFFQACEKFMVFGKKLPCTTVLISITSACRYRCKHCYQKYDKGRDIDLNILVEVVKKLQDMGIAFFNIEGGEPFLVYDRLKAICESIDERSEIWINSTGSGVDLDKLRELKKLNVTAIMFSLHSAKPHLFNSFIGDESAWDNMIKAIELCHKADISVAINTCLPKSAFYDGTFEEIMEKAKEFKASIVQVIKPKPAGGWLESGVEEFTKEDIEQVKHKVNIYNQDPKFIDYPSISAQIIEEEPEVFGCTAGGTDRFYINAKGDLQPCEFLNISFGNIETDDFNSIYDRMRSHFEHPGDCMLCERYSKEIYRLFIGNDLKSLPLPPELSEKIYGNWDRGEETDLYKKCRELE